MEKVSIIIPVYNVEQYIGRCLDSVISQAYPKLEIILVDDGSSDCSGRICDEYSVKDSRIKCFHKENNGLSSARNYGLDNATGDYICFVDSDDFIHTEFVSYLLEIIKKSESEIAMCRFEAGSENEFTPQNNFSYKSFTSNEVLRNWHRRGNDYETAACFKMISAAIIKRINFRFPSGNHEDVRTSHLLVHNSNRIVITDRKLYYYYQREGSITSKKKMFEKNAIINNLNAQDERLSFFKNNGYVEAYHRLAVGRQKYYVLFYVNSKDTEIKKKIINCFDDAYKEIKHAKAVSLGDKFLFFLFHFYTTLSRRLFKWQ